MTHIETLNRRLGESLGFVGAGKQPRFQWMFGPKIPYWNTRLGWLWQQRRMWVLCQWMSPQMSEQEWSATFRGRYPYPTHGMYHPYSETAVPDTSLTDELNHNYIRVIDQQMATSDWSHCLAVKNEVKQDTERRDNDWTEYTQSFAPAFENWNAGNRGGHVSFGGI